MLEVRCGQPRQHAYKHSANDVTAALANIEADLRGHFSRLAEVKKARGSSHPVFVLEHGLTTEQRAALGKLLGESLKELAYVSDSYSVSWVVHAAESGYTFDGLEYWDSFAEATPNWYAYGNREALRHLFKQFQRKYQGVRPSGAWAKHYAYICWPITNALLPRDLQTQLARALYSLRYQLASSGPLTDEQLGDMVALHADNPTSRFAWFLQDRQLVGWIVRALLETEAGDKTAIEQRTLQRVIDDVRSHGFTKAWLSEVQRVYTKYRTKLTSFHVQTLQQSPAFGSTGSPATTGARTNAEPSSLAPVLSLRRASSDSWAVQVQIPSLRALIDSNDTFAGHLQSAAVRIPAHGPALFPASALLSNQGLLRTLKAWPAPRKCLLEFNKKNPAFDSVVTPECQIAPSTLWLFKIRDDGVARQILGTSVRPGEKYIAVSPDMARVQSLGSPVKLECAGVHAAWFDVPKVVTDALQARLRQAGFSATYSVIVEPVGLLPRGWDGQSLGEWLTTETPCFAIQRDHEFDSCQLRVDDGPWKALTFGAHAKAFVAVRDLEVGPHAITVVTCRANLQGGMKEQRRSVLPFQVRAPHPWTPGSLSASAMLVTCTPSTPTLHDFVQGRVDLQVEGDISRKVTVSLALLDDSGRAGKTIQVCSQYFPLSLEDWREAAGDVLRLQKGSEDLDFLAPGGGSLVIDGEELGHRRIALRHVPQPLRWLYRRIKGGAGLRLVNDSEASDLVVQRFGFSAPLRGESLDPTGAENAMVVEQNDGLFVARGGEFSGGVIVSHRSTANSLSALGIQFEAAAFGGPLGGVFQAFDRWFDARPCDPLSRHRQHMVLRALHTNVLWRAAGRMWLDLEDELVNEPRDDDWSRLEMGVNRSSYGIALGRLRQKQFANESEAQAAYTAVTRVSRISNDSSLAELAWKLAAGLEHLVEADRQRLAAGLNDALTIMTRGARLVQKQLSLAAGRRARR
jgi:hypothetical protein